MTTPNKYLVQVGQHVKKIREALGLSQEELATVFNRRAPRDLKVTRMDVSKYERATVRMPADKYLKLRAMNPPDNSLD